MTQLIEIEKIELNWSEWYQFKSLKLDIRYSNIRVSIKSGVYEAKCPQTEEILTIGKATILHDRIRSGLVKGHLPHSSGKRISKAYVGCDHDSLLVRWAETNRPAAVEEELHKLHQQKYGRLPIYTERT